VTVVDVVRLTPSKVLVLLCSLGVASFASPWVVAYGYLTRPLYPWDFIEHVQNRGDAEEAAAHALKIVLVSTLAAAIGVVGYRRPFGARPILLLMVLLPMVGALLVVYGTLVFVDLTTVRMVAEDPHDLWLPSRVAWLSGPLMRATAVQASLTSAWVATQTRRVPAS
jgi:hypothetical protein